MAFIFTFPKKIFPVSVSVTDWLLSRAAMCSPCTVAGGAANAPEGVKHTRTEIDEWRDNARQAGCGLRNPQSVTTEQKSS